MTKDSVRRTGEILNADKKYSEAANQRFAEEEEIKKAQAPSIWQALGQSMKKHCEDCNAQAGEIHLEFKAGESNEFDVVSHVHPDTLRVVFNPRAYTIKYHREGRGWVKVADELIKDEGKEKGTFYPKVDGKQLLYTLDDTSMTVEQMGERLTKALLPMLASR
jgi:hypothetical protein